MGPMPSGHRHGQQGLGILTAVDDHHHRLRRHRFPGHVGQAVSTGLGQHRQRGGDLGHPFGVGIDRDQIRLGEVPVVVGLFLGAHGVGPTIGVVPMPGFLHDLLARGVHVGLAGCLVLDGPAQRPQRVQVLDLTAGAQFGGPLAADRHVGVDPHRALLHLPVADATGHQDRTELGHVLAGLFGGADVRSRHDLQERNPSAVVVDEGVFGAVDTAGLTPYVGGLAGVLLQMGPLDADHVTRGELQGPVDHDRLVVLGDLEVLGHIRVEVVLPGEHRAPD